MPSTACRAAMVRILLDPRLVLHKRHVRPNRRLDARHPSVKVHHRKFGRSEMDRLKGKAAIVTGAASGIGRASAKLFAAEGAKVLCFHRAADVEETANAIKSAGGSAIALKADASSAADVAKAVDNAVQEFGKLDVIYANAGV